MKNSLFKILPTNFPPVCDIQTGRVSITTKAYSIVIFLLLFSPFISSAQLPFVVHMPFHGEPLFCHETACIRKVAVAKKIKKSRHKRRVVARKLARKEKKEVVIEPIENRMRPKFE